MGGIMPLTPEDVSNKRFTPVRLREGYDMGEVDQFLDEVEAELARLTKENDDLRSKLSAAQTGGRRRLRDTSVHRPDPRGPGAPSPSPPAPATPVRRRAGRRPPAPRRSGSRPSPRRRTPPRGCSRSPPGTPTSWSSQPRTRPTRSSARPAPRPSGSSPSPRPRPTALESDARTRAQMLDSETSERRQQMFGELERERDKLNGEVETLRAFEREYRSPAQELLHPAARGAVRARESRPRSPTSSRRRPSGCARSSGDEDV